jgi:hypothetical protein
LVASFSGAFGQCKYRLLQFFLTSILSIKNSQ